MNNKTGVQTCQTIRNGTDKRQKTANFRKE